MNLRWAGPSPPWAPWPLEPGVLPACLSKKLSPSWVPGMPAGLSVLTRAAQPVATPSCPGRPPALVAFTPAFTL